MKKADWKIELQEAFKAPEPCRKEQFLKKFPKAQISNIEFMFLQAVYMKKWIWVVSALIFAVALKGAYFVRKDLVWTVSAMMPFAALSIMTENARSAVYDMEELEMASRFSLKSVTLARLGILGCFHFFLLCLLVPVSLKSSSYTFLQTGVYLTVPYLLTVVPGLAVVRKIHGKESFYITTGIAVFVSVAHMTVSSSAAYLYEIRYFSWWAAAALGLMAAMAVECRRTIKQAERIG